MINFFVDLDSALKNSRQHIRPIALPTSHTRLNLPPPYAMMSVSYVMAFTRSRR